MTIKEVADKLGLKSLTKVFDKTVTGVYISDMVSDVIANAKAGNILVTVQVHNNVIAAANLVDVAGIVITRGRGPTGDMLALAEKAEIPIFATEMNAWQVAGMLYEAGIR
jgi:predicted transcriptional regulator